MQPSCTQLPAFTLHKQHNCRASFPMPASSPPGYHHQATALCFNCPGRHPLAGLRLHIHFKQIPFSRALPWLLQLQLLATRFPNHGHLVSDILTPSLSANTSLECSHNTAFLLHRTAFFTALLSS